MARDRVGQVMTSDLLSVSREETVREAAARMIERWVGAAVVAPREPRGGPGIMTERDVLRLVGAGEDPGATRVAQGFTAEATCAAPDWSLRRAAEAMDAGGFRHLVVTDDGRTVGIISIRDIARVWVRERSRLPTNLQIREAMTGRRVVLSRDQTLFAAARRMVEEGVAAAVVEPARPKAPPGIITDRDLLAAVAGGREPRTERVTDHLSVRMTFSAPDWSLLQAGEAMVKGGFQHVVVVDARGTIGVISMNDVIRHWLD